MQHGVVYRKLGPDPFLDGPRASAGRPTKRHCSASGSDATLKTDNPDLRSMLEKSKQTRNNAMQQQQPQQQQQGPGTACNQYQKKAAASQLLVNSSSVEGQDQQHCLPRETTVPQASTVLGQEVGAARSKQGRLQHSSVQPAAVNYLPDATDIGTPTEVLSTEQGSVRATETPIDAYRQPSEHSSMAQHTSPEQEQQEALQLAADDVLLRSHTVGVNAPGALSRPPNKCDDTAASCATQAAEQARTQVPEAVQASEQQANAAIAVIMGQQRLDEPFVDTVKTPSMPAVSNAAASDDDSAIPHLMPADNGQGRYCPVVTSRSGAAQTASAIAKAAASVRNAVAPVAQAAAASKQHYRQQQQQVLQNEHSAGAPEACTVAWSDDSDGEYTVFQRRPAAQSKSRPPPPAIQPRQQQQQLQPPDQQCLAVDSNLSQRCPEQGGSICVRPSKHGGSSSSNSRHTLAAQAASRKRMPGVFAKHAVQQPQPRQQQQQLKHRHPQANSSTVSTSSCKVPAAAATAAVLHPRRHRSSAAVPLPAGIGRIDLCAAVAAAGVAVLDASAAELRGAGGGEVTADPQQFHLGDKLTKRAKLYIKRPGSDEWQKVSKSCHDCQEQHVQYKCKEKGCKGSSICNVCLVNRYHGLHSLAELHARCPLCRGECTCRKCLRKADHLKLLPMPSYCQQQRHVFGLCTLLVVGPLLAAFMNKQNAESVAWGYAGGLTSVPRKPLTAGVRLLCDRCATQAVGLVAHCAVCGWDCCSSCAAVLRQHRQQAAAESRPAPVTCCNPSCPSVVCRLPSRAARAAEQRCVARGELRSATGAAVLNLEVLLPADLLTSLDKLQQLAQEYRIPRALQLSDCPLLPPGAAAGLCGPRGLHLSLKQLQANDWWECLPQHLRDPWRRQVTSSSWMFTPHIQDLAGVADIPKEAAAAAQLSQVWGAGSGWQQQQSHLALALFWARWQLGEPILVRGATGRLKWDPATLRRAVRDIRAERAKQKQTASTSGCSNSIILSSKAGTKVSVNSSRTADCCGSGSERDSNSTDGEGSGQDDDDDDDDHDDDDDDDDDDDGRRVCVLDCEDFSKTDITEHEFFLGYTQGHMLERVDAHGVPHQVLAMLKVKDWPPRSQLKEEMQRHYLDFLEALPVRAYTDPRLGHSLLNLASGLQPADNPTDLGPKCYVAYGRVAEAKGEGDSVTKLHVDMSDAINLLLHTDPGTDLQARAAAAEAAAQPGAVRCGQTQANKPSYDGAGAVWDICPRGRATQQLAGFLTKHAADFTHQGQPVCAEDDPMVHINPIFTQKFMLVEHHRQQLAAEQQLELWHFEQHRGEAVFIPGGCPHQVRNLQSCCKIAVDFVSPESLSEAINNRERLRSAELALEQELSLGPNDRDYQEKLQSQLMLLRGALRASDLVGSPAAAAGGAVHRARGEAETGKLHKATAALQPRSGCKQ